MLKENKSKIFSMSGFCFVIKIHDGNFAAITMSSVLKIFLGKKPFNCLKQKQIEKTKTELYNIKEIFIKNDHLNLSKNENNYINIKDKKIYFICYAKDILIFSFENNYQKCFLIQKIINNNYIGALIQLNDKNIIFWDKKNTINLLIYLNEKKPYFQNEIIQPKLNNKKINSYILSFAEFEKNNIITTSTNKHPLGENAIRIYKIENMNNKNSKLINYKNFIGYSCSIFENNIIKFENKKTICIALNYYIKNNIIFNNSSILFINYEYLEITTILEINYSVNSIFNFFLISKEGNNKIYEYIIISQFKSKDNNKTKKKGNDNYRFLDFYIFDPKYEYDPLLIEEKRIETKSSIDITNSFILNEINLLIFQTDQISLYDLFTK